MGSDFNMSVVKFDQIPPFVTNLINSGFNLINA